MRSQDFDILYPRRLFEHREETIRINSSLFAYTCFETYEQRGCQALKEPIEFEDRSVLLGQYIIEHKATVRACAKQFGISKSTVHKDVSERLKKVNPHLYGQVKQILDINKQERHIRGGMAPREKYRHCQG